jgi:hypothetical protein
MLMFGLYSATWAQDNPTDSAPTPPDTAGVAEADGLETGQQTHDLQLRQLEEKVNHLKEKIFRSKARLMLLQETILHGVIAGSKTVITHRNQMGAGFKLESVAYYLDGAPIFGKINLDGGLDSDKPIEIYNGTIQPGNHLLSVYMVYRGDSSVFVYVEGIQVKLKTSYSFKAEEGKISHIDVVGFDKGGVTSKFDERPAVKFETRFSDIQDEEIQPESQQQAEQGS